MKYVPDTSTIINGQFLKYISEQKNLEEIILSRVVIAEIENMANQAKTTGIAALEELQRMRDFCAKNGYNIIIDGSRPTYNQIRGAAVGELDAKIRELAEEYQAILVTSDRVMAEIGKAEGLAVVYIKETTKSIGKRIEDYFDENTMSIHLRENNKPLAKKGKPGNFELISLSEEEILSREFLEDLSKDIVERARREEDSFIESDQYGTTVVQLKNSRIVIIRPPFSDAMEITAVKPILKLTLNDYKLDSILLVRDLVLLMRPDYVIYDELRKTKDFETYSDLRLAGIGLIGVVHATQAIDGIQRFIKRVDLGVIPSIVDTIIFIDEGDIAKTYTLELTVKLPTGMRERDLTRPVVIVKDFHTNKPEYEIYTFGEQIVVAPLISTDTVRKSFMPQKTVSPSIIQKTLKKYSIYDYNFDFNPPNSLTLYVTKKDKPRIIGKDGKRIEEIEQKLGLSIDVRTFDERTEEAEFIIDVYPIKNKVNLVFPSLLIGKDVIVSIDGNELIQLTVGKAGEISIDKNSQIGREIMSAYSRGATISALF